jgi:hypothetical protein
MRDAIDVLAVVAVNVAGSVVVGVTDAVDEGIGIRVPLTVCCVPRSELTNRVC